MLPDNSSRRPQPRSLIGRYAPLVSAISTTIALRSTFRQRRSRSRSLTGLSGRIRPTRPGTSKACFRSSQHSSIECRRKVILMIRRLTLRPVPTTVHSDGEGFGQ